MKVATIKGDADCDDPEELDNIWGQIQDRLSLNSVAANDAGEVGMKWCSTSKTQEEDVNMSFLDDIWGTALPSSTCRGSKRHALEDGSDGEAESEAKKRRHNSSGEDTQEKPEKPEKVEKPNKRRQGPETGKQTGAATLVRVLNGCDSLALEARQNLDLLAEEDTMRSIGSAAISKLLDKIASKLTTDSIAYLTEHWETGQPLNRGCHVVEKLKSLHEGIKLAHPVVLALQARSGTKDGCVSHNLWLVMGMELNGTTGQHSGKYKYRATNSH